MDIPDFEEDAKNVVKPVFKWIAGARYGYVKGYSDCVEKEVKPLKEENDKLRKILHNHNNMCQGKLTKQINEMLPQIQQLKQEIEILKAAKP